MKPLVALRSAVDMLKQDVFQAFRHLVHAPAFTAAALVVLALGIGANAAIFAVVDAVLLKPLPYAEPDRLVTVMHVPPQATFPGVPRFPASPANYLDWQQRQQVFQKMAAMQFAGMTLTGRGEPEQMPIGRVSSTFFDLFGIRMLAGRGFLAEEEVPGRHQVAVLSHSLWTNRFGGDRGVIGQTMLLDGMPYQIVGIADAPFDRPPLNLKVWVPLAWPPIQRANRGGHSVSAFARLAPGVTLAEARTAMSGIASALEREYPAENTGWGATVDSLPEVFVGDTRTTLLFLLGAVTFVLLIACANVANLILVRAIAQRPEMAVRVALGASPWRIARYVLTESTLLGLGAGLLGLLVGNAGMRLLATLLVNRLPQGLQLHPGANVFVFTMAVSVLAGVGAGLWPALRLSRASLVDAIKEGGARGDSDASGSVVRTTLVVVEVSLSLVLLVGAGLMVRTIWQLNSVDPGFDSRNVVAGGISLPTATYLRGEQRQQFFDNVMERLRALPDVESAAVVMSLPLRRNPMSNNWPLSVIGRPPLQLADQPNVQGNVVSPDYFRTLHIPLRRGRLLTDADRQGTGAVAVISEAMAQQIWPGQDPIGQRLVLAFFADAIREVVGVVGNVREGGLTTEGSAAIYLPYAQLPYPSATLVIRTRTASPVGTNRALTTAVHQVDPERPVLDVLPMETIVARSFGDRRATMILLVVFAGLALVLAAVGIYSVLAYSVRRRTREIGIRMALGSARGTVTRMVVKDAMRPTIVGIVIGIVAAIALRKVVATFVFGVSASDPLTLALVSTLFVLVSFLASALPAYRASRVDPIITLRAE